MLEGAFDQDVFEKNGEKLLANAAHLPVGIEARWKAKKRSKRPKEHSFG